MDAAPEVRLETPRKGRTMPSRSLIASMPESEVPRASRNKTVSAKLFRTHLACFHKGVNIINQKRAFFFPIFRSQHCRCSLSVRHILKLNDLALVNYHNFAFFTNKVCRLILFADNE